MRLYHATSKERIEGILQSENILPTILQDTYAQTKDLKQAQEEVTKYLANKTGGTPEVQAYIESQIQKDPYTSCLWMGTFEGARKYVSDGGVILGFDADETIKDQIKQQIGDIYCAHATIPLKNIKEAILVKPTKNELLEYNTLLKPYQLPTEIVD